MYCNSLVFTLKILRIRRNTSIQASQIPVLIPISINRRELICTYIAQRTEEILGKILKCCAWSNVLLGYPYFGVILPSAYVTNIFFHSCFI